MRLITIAPFASFILAAPTKHDIVPTIVFTHSIGTWHGTWAFHTVRGQLERLAYPNEAVTLPSVGSDSVTDGLVEDTVADGFVTPANPETIFYADVTNTALVVKAVAGLEHEPARNSEDALLLSKIKIYNDHPVPGQPFADIFRPHCDASHSTAVTSNINPYSWSLGESQENLNLTLLAKAAAQVEQESSGPAIHHLHITSSDKNPNHLPHREPGDQWESVKNRKLSIPDVPKVANVW
ncbi:hypothetical protein DL95DRAFT_529561 [Leptodontidium sp. 2 PMI_412]|nr:hypothetical protein DL95DRAFT_529561 [Leptodontidium sp. 2 PMI_412]